jgi:hypothetical protein
MLFKRSSVALELAVIEYLLEDGLLVFPVPMFRLQTATVQVLEASKTSSAENESRIYVVVKYRELGSVAAWKTIH